ncbi:asparaginase [Persicitalea jodogahamensis]|uniref:asparaginase n=1 Tax=Persicitalea jodogahamensis TaxID=402147 RepID=A0A8J3GBE7_9BACT|nr:asparaginase [Persicitalea jodogahamensis]GHB81279.1 L-asparaginase 1 [Persicitalea jodogahamensis]
MPYNIIRLNTPKTQPSDLPVLVIYTGGTLGMVYDTKEGQLVPFEFKQVLDLVPEVRRLTFGISFLAFDEPIDSANMTPELWQELAKIISAHYDAFDSFVILHGTDTMAYTASALSFMLNGLNKAVILTGAQLPIGIARSDARENFITALEIATAKDKNKRPIISEVCIYFNSVLLRGNRAKKKESSDFNAFHSENYPILAKAGVSIEYNLPYIRPYAKDSKLELLDNLGNQVAFLKIFPGISREVVRSVLSMEGLKGVVLETFGAGNVPTSEWFLAEIGAAIDRKLLIFNVSQCDGGRVMQGLYQSSLFLRDLGVVSGSDCTAEAAITKMMFVLGQTDDFGKQAELLKKPLCGEMSI